AAFWRKCQRQTSGCCTQPCAEPPASSSSSSAGSLVISWHQVIMRPDKVRRTADYVEFLVGAQKFTDAFDVRRWILGVPCFLRITARHSPKPQSAYEQKITCAWRGEPLDVAQPSWLGANGHLARWAIWRQDARSDGFYPF